MLRRERAASGLTQEQLAERSGLGIRTIRELEHDRVRRPHRESIALLAGVLTISPAAREELVRTGGQGCFDGASSSGSAEYVAPAQLPADIADFTGRRTRMRELIRLLTGPPAAGQRRTTVPVCTITGADGIGKTALAVHVSQQIRDHYPDGHLFIDLHGSDSRPAEPAEVLARFLRDLGVDKSRIPSDVKERAARYRSLVAGLRLLVVLDNAQSAAQVQPLLPGGSGCAVVLTSRSCLTGLPANHVLELETLEPAEAQALLTRIIGPARAAAEPDALKRVLAVCAGVPLAIRAAGIRLALHPGWTVSSLADRLADHHSWLAGMAG